MVVGRQSYVLHIVKLDRTRPPFVGAFTKGKKPNAKALLWKAKEQLSCG